MATRTSNEQRFPNWEELQDGEEDIGLMSQGIGDGEQGM